MTHRSIVKIDRGYLDVWFRVSRGAERPEARVAQNSRVAPSRELRYKSPSRGNDGWECEIREVKSSSMV